MRLPLNCSADYYGDFLSEEEASELCQSLIHEHYLDKSQLVAEVAGEMVVIDTFKILFLTERLIKLNSHPEKIHGRTYVWSGAMARLRTRIEEWTEREFEIAMCIYYPNGDYFSPYHFDQQTSGINTIIPSISLGEVREFSFKENDSDEVYSLDLANGSLLLMRRYCQDRYTHSLPKNPKCKSGRINITFREPNFI